MGSRPRRGRWAPAYAVLWSMVDFTFFFSRDRVADGLSCNFVGCWRKTFLQPRCPSCQPINSAQSIERIQWPQKLDANITISCIYYNRTYKLESVSLFSFEFCLIFHSQHGFGRVPFPGELMQRAFMGHYAIPDTKPTMMNTLKAEN